MSVITTLEEKIVALAGKLKVDVEAVVAKLHTLFDEGVVEAKVLETEAVTKIENLVHGSTPATPPVAPEADSNTTVS